MSHAPIFTADWGILNLLFALHPSHRYTELAFALQGSTGPALEQLGSSLASIPGPKLFVTHANHKLVFPQVNVNLFNATAHHLHFLATVAGGDGKPVYELYTYR